MWSKIKTFLSNHWVSIIICVLSLCALCCALWLSGDSISIEADVDVAVDAIMKNSSVQLPK